MAPYYPLSSSVPIYLNFIESLAAAATTTIIIAIKSFSVFF